MYTLCYPYIFYIYSCSCTFLFITVTDRSKHQKNIPSLAMILELSIGSKHVICQLEFDEGPTTLYTRFWALVRPISWFQNHITTDQHGELYPQSIKTDYPSFTKAMSVFSVAITTQLMQPLTCMVSMSLFHYHGRDCTSCAHWSTCDYGCALVSLPDQWPWSLIWKWGYLCGLDQKLVSYAMDVRQLGSAVNRPG